MLALYSKCFSIVNIFSVQDYNDEIRQAQLQELTYLNGGSENADVPVVRGKSTLRTRGVTTTAITR